MYREGPSFVSDDIPVRHGFFTRQGGVSTGIYESLNCGAGSDDDPEAVQENMRRVAAEMGVMRENLLTLRQVHGKLCIYADKAWPRDKRPEADAIVTDRPGIALGILTADCAPVLFHGMTEEGGTVIGAAHAGWGGALKGVLGSTVNCMKDLGVMAETIHACIGPCIGLKSYEVSYEFRLPFLEQDPDHERFFYKAARPGHLMFDLNGYVKKRLEQAGASQVSDVGADTYPDAETYFSYRRSVHQDEPDYGRQIAVIAISE